MFRCHMSPLSSPIYDSCRKSLIRVCAVFACGYMGLCLFGQNTTEAVLHVILIVPYQGVQMSVYLTAGDFNFVHLTKMVSSRFLYCKVTNFSFSN